jgi:hypothetical protein
LSLSTGTATSPFPSPPFLVPCPFENHIFCLVSSQHRKEFKGRESAKVVKNSKACNCHQEKTA